MTTTPIIHCGHGFPSASSCVECMAEGPVEAAEPIDWTASRWATATLEQRCCADPSHAIEVGDRIGYVDLVGWCCGACAKGDG